MLAAARFALSALAALAAAPPTDPGEAAARFRAEFPLARVVPGRGGGLEHASGFSAPAGPGGEAAARRFLALHGAAFGVVDAVDGLALLRAVGGPGEGGALVFQRKVDGLPVFGGEVAVGLSAAGAVTLVSGSPAPAVRRSGAFLATPQAARAAALREGEGPAAEPEVEAGWLEFGGRLLPAYRVRIVSRTPPGVFHAYVGGESGRILYRVSLAVSAQSCPPCAAPPCICAYRDSPIMDSSAPSPPGPDGYPPLSRPALGLPSPVPAGGQPLSGRLASVFNCRGADLSLVPSGCPAQMHSDGGGSFLSPPDPTGRDPGDAFAEQAAYFHVDAQSRFLAGLDRAFPGIGFITAFVNVFDGGAPLDNAFYIPAGDAGTLVLGQGKLVDLSYDAELVYHELTHAAANATTRFEPYVDSLGVNIDPSSVDEGTADTFAFANPDVLQPCFASYFARSFGLPCLRDADNRRTCRGNGDASNPGRGGEPHEDGEIWSGFTWALFKAAMDRDAADGSGSRLHDAMVRALFRSLETAGSHASFEGYAATVRAQVAADPDLGAAGADFVACTASQRDLAGCADRTVPMYSGERFSGVVHGVATVSPAPQQYFIDVPCGATALRILSGDDSGRGLLFIRYGNPVQFDGPDLQGVHYDWLLPQRESEAILTSGPAPCPACDACGTHTPLGAGRWYFLPAGVDRAVFQLGLAIEAPAGVTVPARTAYLFGRDPSGQEVNLCAWGGPATPWPPEPPAYDAPPDLGSCAPPAASDVSLPKQCRLHPPPSADAGCGCGSTGGGALLPFLAVALRARRRPVRAA